MRLDGGESLAGVKDPSLIFPSHFTKYYPKLVEFFEVYVDSLYSDEVSSEQLTLMWNDESWWDKKDVVFESVDQRTYAKVEDLLEFKRTLGVSSRAVSLIEDKSLEKQWFALETLDGFVFEPSNLEQFQLREDNYFHIQAWLQSKGLFELVDTKNSQFQGDLELFLRISRNLFKMRGTMECARAFFMSMYGGRTVIEFPRDKISTLDDNFILDGNNVLRDDVFYDEFTYVVNLIGSNYSKIGDKYVEMYLRVFHAAGFRCLIRTYTEVDWLLAGNDVERLPSIIDIWKLFFDGKFVQTIRNL